MSYILKNLKSFSKNSTSIFILFVLCQLIASLVLLLSFGTFQNFKLVKENKNDSSQLYIQFGRVTDQFEEDGVTYYYCDGETDNKSVKKFLQGISPKALSELEFIYYTAVSENTDIPLLDECDNNTVSFRLEYSEKYKTFVPYKTAFENSPTSFGETYTEREFANGMRKLILPCNFSEDYLYKMLHIENIPYLVCGIDYVDSMLSIPFVTSPDTLSHITQISFFTDTVMSEVTYNEICRACADTFGNYAFIPPIDTVDDKLPYYNSIMIISVLLAVLTSITLALLFKYVLQQRNKTISVLRICGCTINKARRIFILEILLMSVLCSAISCLVYFGFFINPLQKVFVYIKYVYNFKNVLILFGLDFIIIYI